MMHDFQAYQRAFTAHIRDPKANRKPANVVEKRMAVYREAVFNNILESVSACFPVCQSVLGKRVWHQLIRKFLATHSANTPIFREIPQEFLTFLSAKDALPVYIPQLAHYEWVELAVNMQPAAQNKLRASADLLNRQPMLAPSHMLLEYDYPVHKISAKFKPKAEEKTFLLVFRNAQFEVKFIELNPMTYALLKLLKENELTGKQALTRLANEIQHPNTEAIIEFGMNILLDLANQQAIIGNADK